MLRLNDLFHWRVCDEHGHQAKLHDIEIATVNEPALAKSLQIRLPHAAPQVLPWSAVHAIDVQARMVYVASFQAQQEEPPENVKQIWLRRDVLDALVIDIPQQRVVRINELLLHALDKQLHVQAIDVNPWAVIRQLSRGKWGKHPRHEEIIGWKQVVYLWGDPAFANECTQQCQQLALLPPAEIAHLSDVLPYLHAAELLCMLPEPVAADTFEELAIERQLQVLNELPDQRRRAILSRIAPDAAAQLFTQLDPDAALDLLESLPEPQQSRVVELLRYPSGTAGAIMTNDMIVVPASLSVGETRSMLREQTAAPDFASFLYVVDDTSRMRLQGVVTLRALATADDARLLADLMQTHLYAAHSLEPAKQVAYRVIDSHLAAIPVFADDKRLLGIVTVDAAIAEVAPASVRAQVPRIFS